MVIARSASDTAILWDCFANALNDNLHVNLLKAFTIGLCQECFGHWNILIFCHCFGFRISCFGFMVPCKSSNMIGLSFRPYSSSTHLV